MNPTILHRSISINSLPSEIQDAIFCYALIHKEQVPVYTLLFHTWASQQPSQSQLGNFAKAPGHELIRSYSTMNSALSQIAFGLLRTSKMVSRHAAAVFYSKNRFGFAGLHDLEPVLSWLHGIGDNASHVKNLRIVVREPRTQEMQFQPGVDRYYPHCHRHLAHPLPHPHRRRCVASWKPREKHIQEMEDLLRSLPRLGRHHVSITIRFQGLRLMGYFFLTREEMIEAAGGYRPSAAHITHWRFDWFVGDISSNARFIFEIATTQDYLDRNRADLGGQGWVIGASGKAGTTFYNSIDIVRCALVKQTEQFLFTEADMIHLSEPVEELETGPKLCEACEVCWKAKGLGPPAQLDTDAHDYQVVMAELSHNIARRVR
ncbi:hypothetical protein CAC42_4077 [Sphaceloma murrayae]|uniref:Uncharacterized protein n=1 Tax=Sphaceloma murrayae TaxID=2082308 RepID=A0A2K1QKD5_9PEZI|nr:hypothetical protein CAC42_4077 [Sphaceloma murrayae]